MLSASLNKTFPSFLRLAGNKSLGAEPGDNLCFNVYDNKEGALTENKENIVYDNKENMSTEQASTGAIDPFDMRKKHYFNV